MAETLRELVVALSLDSSNFSRNMRTINQQIKEAESTFRLAGAGVQNYEKTIAGTEAKLSMLGQKLTQQQRAVEQYSRALVAANDKLKENYDRHQDYTHVLSGLEGDAHHSGDCITTMLYFGIFRFRVMILRQTKRGQSPMVSFCAPFHYRKKALIVLRSI
ncbi:MAG: hypothetical protein Q4G00_08060 [Clostridia bacterium]|nr:hypothetical protein [Clostridia bacterium]